MVSYGFACNVHLCRDNPDISQQKCVSEALVEFDYIAKKSDELTIKKGDIIKEVVKKQPGWCEGVLNDKRGVFPDNFVKFLEKDVIYRNKKDSLSLRQCKVIFSYQPLHPDELALNVGDVIDIVGEDEEGWWKGIHSGKEGVFPSNFVEEIFPTKPKPTAGSREDLTNVINDTEPKIPNLPPKPGKILCIVKYAYKAQNEDELSLKEGDVISLTNRDLPDPGWWEGELNGKVGVFPDNFVVVIKQDDDKLPKDDMKHLKPHDSISSKPTQTITQRTSLEPKTDQDNKPNPPLLKKPDLLKKISPSSVSKGFRGFVGGRKGDSVDGIGSSKSHTVKNDVKHDEKKERNGENSFDHVERTPLLKDVRAGRAKPPIRRPPTSSVTKDKSPAFESEDMISSEDEPQDKPSMREWEKHKAPWLEEMKMNQAKRSSTSPISEKNLNTKGGLFPELDKSPMENIMSKSMPCAVASKISPNDTIDNNKTPPVVSSTGSMKANKPPNNLQNLSKNNYSNVDIPALISPNATNSKPPISSSSNSNKYKNTNSNEKQPTTNSNPEKQENNRISGEFGQEIMVLTVQQYTKILERINRLEVMVEMQASTIEDLKSKFLIEKDKRKLIETQKL
ncbi:sh3 domain-containing [Holotrichia oblita]|uniref:Sh3 domain-containing n=1 Tax=Holotrichia oblita TaxID=644536 RepID=A0ACB9T072_HOLOL|nr:sh3 domain-containing [Holotrichia oblita]